MTPSITHVIDQDYQQFEQLIADRVASLKGPLFTTDASGLFDAWLAGIPGESWFMETVHGEPTGVKAHSGPRQHYNCRHCMRFIERYGGLVNIQDDGRITNPVFWELAKVGPEFFQQSIRNIDPILTKAKVTGALRQRRGSLGHTV